MITYKHLDNRYKIPFIRNINDPSTGSNFHYTFPNTDIAYEIESIRFKIVCAAVAVSRYFTLTFGLDGTNEEFLRCGIADPALTNETTIIQFNINAIETVVPSTVKIRIGSLKPNIIMFPQFKISSAIVGLNVGDIISDITMTGTAYRLDLNARI